MLGVLTIFLFAVSHVSCDENASDETPNSGNEGKSNKNGTTESPSIENVNNTTTDDDTSNTATPSMNGSSEPESKNEHESGYETTDAYDENPYAEYESESNI